MNAEAEMPCQQPVNAEAVLLSPPYSVLTYKLIPGFSRAFWQPGLRLAVPLGRGLRSAVLLALSDSGPANPANPGYTLKEIAWPLENSPLLGSDYLDLARQFALRQALPLGRVLSGMLPAGLRDKDLRLRFCQPELADFELRQMPALDRARREALAALWESGQGRVIKNSDKSEQELYSLTVAPPWPVRPSAVRQIGLLDFMYACGSTQLSRRHILKELGQDFLPALKQLLSKGLLKVRVDFRPDWPLNSPAEGQSGSRHASILAAPPPFSLNADQQLALDDLCAALNESNPRTRLLYGVTGSGKTAVYLEFAAKTLLAGKSVLLLAPEVALALKLKHDVAERFPGLPTYLFHGYQPQAAREACFNELARKSAPGLTTPAQPVLVVGTRSALFLQLPKLGAVILDEEHDSSFKQDERMVYQAKDLAWYRAGQDKAVLVLGSATPDLKTFYAAEQGSIRLHRLSGRVGGGSLPQITLAPMSGLAGGAGGILTEESTQALLECLNRQEQALILLNRRGYAPTMFCLSCGTTARCPRCEISLTYHKKREKLICHYCGYAEPFPTPCQVCKSTHFLPLGEGTEKLEERLQSLLPTGTRVLRLDRDSAGKPGGLEEILRSFGRGEADVLVGTQMLSKGHHFPRVTLAIVADGDLGLSLPDYNAAERTFQMLLQAAGRSGRASSGRVIIQTRNPDHYCWDYVAASDYEGFYRQELLRRQRRQYPPFVRLALVRMSFPLGWAEGQALVAELGRIMKAGGEAAKVAVLGPAPAPYQMRDRRLRFQCLLKGGSWQDIRAVYAKASAAINARSRQEGFSLSLDLDPVSMM